MTEPLIKLDQAGQALVLRYDVPEPTFYFGRNLIELDFPTEYFLELAGEDPIVTDDDVPADDTEPDPGWVEDIIQGTINDALVDIGKMPIDTEKDRYLKDIKAADLDTGPLDPIGSGPEEPGDPGPRSRLAADRSTTGGSKPTTRSTATEQVDLATVLGLDADVVSANLADGKRPVVVSTASGGATVVYTPIDADHTPSIYLVETYRMSNYTADYGAGRTINTSTLHPGERQKISIKSYKNIESKVSQTHSLFDSYTTTTEDTFETSVQSENSDTQAKEKTSAWNVEAEASGNWGVASASVSGGASGSTNSARETFASNVSSASEKHAATASGQRDVEVNTTSEVSAEEGEETSIEREIENVNISRTLNLGFRQLIQEYVSILHLIDVRVAFYNGYEETRMEVALPDLDKLLDYCVAKDSYKDEIRATILFALGNIVDDAGELHQDFVKTTKYPELDGSITAVHSIDPSKQSVYTLPSGREFEVPGIVMAGNVVSLRTDGVIVDAMLGGGEALDEYAIELQQERVATQRHDNAARVLENRRVATALDIVEAADETKAAIFAQVFGVGAVDAETETETEAA